MKQDATRSGPDPCTTRRRNHTRRILPPKRNTAGLFVLGALLGCVVLMLGLLAAHDSDTRIYAAPIEPPEGEPKITRSTMTASPELVATGGETISYTIEIRNTGAYTAEEVFFTNEMPANATYNEDATSSSEPEPTFADGVLTWSGPVGFDSSVIINYSVTVSSTFEGLIENTAVISEVTTGQAVTVTAETMVTDTPIFTIEKTAEPALPGANQPLTYTLEVTNIGQSTSGTPITVTDHVPADTELLSVGPDGVAEGEVITWTRSVDLDTGETDVFTFSVTVGDVVSGTVITNDDYSVYGPTDAITSGEAYTTTVVDPVLHIDKEVTPNEPGANNESTYEITVLNTGSLATNLVISDTVPDGATHVDGGTYADGVVTWELASLPSNESATFTYTFSISDVAGVDVVNELYSVCSSEDACAAGEVLTSTVGAPTFVVTATMDPISKKPGGGNSPVTPTFVIENLGPGSALDARALLTFDRISVGLGDLVAEPPVGEFTAGPDCGGDKCVSYYWTGDIAAGEVITLTMAEGQSTIGGAEETIYSATLVISDQLGMYATEPVTASAMGRITHRAYLIPYKTAPEVIGPGQLISYTIRVFNSGQAADIPPDPILTDTLPLSTTLVEISDGGEVTEISGTTVVSWTLPAINTGDWVERSFSVRVASSAISGTEIVNSDYATRWFNDGEYYSSAGEPITTTVQDIGLIDSFKVVTPTLLSPGEDNVLTYTINLVNSSPNPVHDVKVTDLLPWKHTTYQRDAVATAGTVISDIVSLEWTGDVAPFSSEAITFTVLVDPDYSGVISNTATITHPSLTEPVISEAVAYVSDLPVLEIDKTAKLNDTKDEVEYKITVANFGQQATSLVVSDVLPLNTEYVEGSASGTGKVVDGAVEWRFPVLKPGEQRTLTFRVKVPTGINEIVNSDYGVTSAEGVSAVGEPLVTEITRALSDIYLPLVERD